MRALVTASYLVRASSLRENSHVNMLNVSARDRERNQILGLAGRGAGMTTNTSRMVDYLRPLDLTILWFFEHLDRQESANYITTPVKQTVSLLRGGLQSR